MRIRFAAPFALALIASPALAAVLSPSTPETRRAFVTSSTHTGNLGGLAGADAICQQRASEGLLPNPGNFVAFLSDSTTDAYCHVHGLIGKRADNCGLPTLPTDVGPWVRTDGFPFAARIDQALAPTGHVYAQPCHDELGNPVGAFTQTWTSTVDTGEVHPSYSVPCSDWTSEDGSAGSGMSWSTTTGFSYSGAMPCSTAHPLLCLEGGSAAPLPPHRAGGAQVFLTAAPTTGALGGTAGADAKCVAAATAAGLPAPGSFVAWISASGSHAKDRLTYDGPWIRLDGVLVANGKSDLLDGTLHAPINLTETGAWLGYLGVWTATQSNGNYLGTDCDGWTSSSAGTQGRYGAANRANQNWSSSATIACDYGGRIFCFSNFPAIVFVDDFESSDSLAWDVTAP